MIDEISEIVNERIAAIDNVLKVCDISDPLPHYSGEAVKRMAKQANRLKNEASRNLVKEERQFDARVNDFEECFQNFLRNFNKLITYCNNKWNMSVMLTHIEPALRYPITMCVSDTKLDLAYDELTNLNHHLAALLLKLAINKTLGSPILIFDSLDYVMEPCMIKYKTFTHDK